MAKNSISSRIDIEAIPLLGWAIDLLFSIVTIGSLLLFGFELEGLNGTLAAAIFTVIVSSTAVFFTAFTSNSELVLAIKNRGYFPKMISYFAIPILTSLLGLLLAVLGASFSSPSWVPTAASGDIFQLVILFLVVYAIYGFIGTVLYVLALMSLTSAVEGENTT